MILLNRQLLLVIFAVGFATAAVAEPGFPPRVPPPGGEFGGSPDDGSDVDNPFDGGDDGDFDDEIPGDEAPGGVEFTDGMIALAMVLADSKPTLAGKSCSSAVSQWIKRVEGLRSTTAFALEEGLIDDELAEAVQEELPKVPKSVAMRCAASDRRNRR